LEGTSVLNICTCNKLTSCPSTAQWHTVQPLEDSRRSCGMHDGGELGYTVYPYILTDVILLSCSTQEVLDDQHQCLMNNSSLRPFLLRMVVALHSLHTLDHDTLSHALYQLAVQAYCGTALYLYYFMGLFAERHGRHSQLSQPALVPSLTCKRVFSL